MFDIDETSDRYVVVDNPCPHGIPADLCEALCAEQDVPDGPVVDLGEAPGARLALACQAAGSVPALLTDGEVLDVVEGAEKILRWAAGLRTRMLAEFADRHPAGSSAAPPGADASGIAPVDRWLPDEVGLTLRVSRQEALGEIARARRFTHVLPDTLAALEQGLLDVRRADAIAGPTTVLPDDKARAVEARVLPDAPDATLRQLRDRVRRAIARVDPAGEHRRHKEADRERRISIRSLDDGMASLWFYGPAEQIEAAWRMADRLARVPHPGGPEHTGDGRTLDQRRFDLAVQLLQGRLTVTDTADVTAAVAGETPPDVLAEIVARVLAGRPDVHATVHKPLIHVVVGLNTLLGSDRAGELVGHGPIHATTARALAAGGVWARLVTDPLSGTLLHHGRATYTPPAALADHVRARDQVCRAPLCTRRVQELDHHRPWAAGGPTDESNLVGYCRHGHLLKDAPGWHVLAHPDGTLTWISPHGRRTTTAPYDYRRFTDDGPDTGVTAAPAPTGTADTDTGRDDEPPPF